MSSSLSASPEIGTYAGLTPPGTSHQASSMSPLAQSPWLNDLLDIPFLVDDHYNAASDYFSSPGHLRVDPYISSPLNTPEDLDTFCQNRQPLCVPFFTHRYCCSYVSHDAGWMSFCNIAISAHLMCMWGGFERLCLPRHSSSPIQRSSMLCVFWAATSRNPRKIARANRTSCRMRYRAYPRRCSTTIAWFMLYKRPV